MPLNAGVICSGNLRLRPVPVHAVTLRSGFWKTKMDANHRVGIPRLLEHLESHGIIDNFMVVSGRKSGERRGLYFSDSDLYKWIEGAAFDLLTYDDPDSKARLDQVIDEVVAAQGDDGYLNTFFQRDLFGERFRNLPLEHELYCAGHLFQAAVAHYRATQSDKLLVAACRFADYLVSVFGYDKRQGVDGHPEIEMALVELYRVTGEKSYLELAEYFMSQLQFPQMNSLAGHAVRALYTCCGGADYLAETGDTQYKTILDGLWEDLTLYKQYVTGGVGSRYANEAIGERYELPNNRAYAETCAAIANAMWNIRMLAIYAEGRFADEMERALYNGVISGVSLDGVSYFYQNPLASYVPYQRQEWFGCTCCPTNMVRTLAALPSYMYAVSDDGIWVNLYAASELRHTPADGGEVALDVSTDYPWDGNVDITVRTSAPAEFGIHLRIPGWCRSAACAVNGQEVVEGITPGTYLELRRVWKPSDSIHLNLGMPVSLVECDPRVRENYGSAAVQRGPLVYCAESLDNPGVSIIDLELESTSMKASFDPDLLGGVVKIEAEGRSAAADAPRGPLYRQVGEHPGVKLSKTPVTLVPYYTWANRGQSDMTVWMPLAGRKKDS